MPINPVTTFIEVDANELADALEIAANPSAHVPVSSRQVLNKYLHLLRPPPKKRRRTTMQLGDLFIENLVRPNEDEDYFLGTWSPGDMLPNFHVEFIAVHNVDSNGEQVGVRDPNDRLAGLCSCVAPENSFRVIEVDQDDQALPPGQYVMHLFPFSE
jgi:hypothetical protein